MSPLPKRDFRRGQLPTCGLVLGEVTLLRKEGSGQHLNSSPPSFYPSPTNSSSMQGTRFPAGQDPRFSNPTFNLPGPQVPLAPFLRLLLAPYPRFPPLAPNPAHPPKAPGPTILTAKLCGTFSCSNGSGSQPNPGLSTPE